MKKNQRRKETRRQQQQHHHHQERKTRQDKSKQTAIQIAKVFRHCQANQLVNLFVSIDQTYFLSSEC